MNREAAECVIWKVGTVGIDAEEKGSPGVPGGGISFGPIRKTGGISEESLRCV